MIREYSVKEIVFILLKRWYIIIGGGILMGVIAIPISELSYNNAVINYNNILSQYKQEKIIQEKETYGLNTVVIEILGRDKELDMREGAINDVMATFMTEHNLMEIFNTLKDTYTYTDYENKSELENYNHFKQNFSCTLVPESNKLIIDLSDSSEMYLTEHIDQINVITTKRIKNLFGREVLLQSINSEFTPTFIMESVKAEQVEDERLASVVMKRPEKSHSYIKLTGTAMISGMFLSSMFIMLITFIKQEKQRN